MPDLGTGRPDPGAAATLDVGGVAVHVVRWAPSGPTSGRRVLLLHGLGAHTLSWEPPARALADRLDADVTAVDLVGFGRTRALTHRATIDTQRRLVTSILEQHGPALVVGNSMGGSIGVAVTARDPGLVHGLVLVDPAVPHPRPALRDWGRTAWLAPLVVPGLGARLVTRRAERLGPDQLVDASLDTSLVRPDAVDPDLRRRMVALTVERLAWPDTPAAYADAARSLVAYMTWGLSRDLGRATRARPTLVLHGREDRLVAVAAVEHAARRHPARLEILDGVGHAPQLEAPGRVVDAIAGWLGERRLPGWDAPADATAAR